MAENEPEKPAGAVAGIGAALLAALGGLATVADDCARAGAHLGSVGDDLGRVATHADDLGHAAVAAEGAAGAGDDLGRVATHLEDASLSTNALVHADAAANASDDLVRDLAEVGLDAADLAGNAVELVGSGEDPSAPPPAKRPRLVEAGKPNPPADGPVDPLVLLVTDTDRARIERLARACASVEHTCLVLACAPTAPNCHDGWRATWAELGSDPALVGHPEAVADALLIAGSSRRETVGTRSARARFTPEGVTVESR